MKEIGRIRGWLTKTFLRLLFLDKRRHLKRIDVDLIQKGPCCKSCRYFDNKWGMCSLDFISIRGDYLACIEFEEKE